MDDWVELRVLLAVMRRWLWLIVAFALLGAVVTIWQSSNVTPIYRTSATLRVSQAPAVGLSEIAAIQTSQRLAQTYAKLLIRRSVIEETSNRLKTGYLGENIRVDLVADTELIRLSVEHTDPAMAALVANTIAEVFIVQNEGEQTERYSDSLSNMQEQINELSTLIEETQADVDALSASTTQGQSELARLEALKAEDQATYKALKEDYDEMQLINAQSKESLLVLEPAQVPQSPVQPNYITTTTLQINQTLETIPSSYDDALASEVLVNTYAQTLNGPPVLKEAIAQLGLDETAEELANRLQVVRAPDIQLIKLSVTHADPAWAAFIANTIADVFIAQVNILQQESEIDPSTSTQEQLVELTALKAETRAVIGVLGLDIIQAGKDSVHIIEPAKVPENPGEPSFIATVTLMVRPTSEAAQSGLSGGRNNEQLAGTYAQLMGSRAVLEASVGQLGLDETPDGLANRLQVKRVPDSQLIQLCVTHSDPTLAAFIANTLAEVSIAQIQALHQESYADVLPSTQRQMEELSTQIEQTQATIDAVNTNLVQDNAELVRQENLLSNFLSDLRSFRQNYEMMRLTAAQSTDNVDIFEDAQVPRSPINARTPMKTMLAAVVGAAVAMGVAFTVEHLDDRIKTPDDVRQAVGLDIVGMIGRIPNGKARLIVTAQPHSPVSEDFRMLRTNVRFSNTGKPLRTLLVTSPDPLDGKSIVVANLALAIAQADLSVVAMDGDLRVPRQEELFGLGLYRDGLSQALLDGALDGRLQPVPVKRLKVLPAGDLPPNPAELLGSPVMQKLLEQLCQEADVVLIDGPPVLPVADAAVLAQTVDGVLLVVQAGRTRRGSVQRAVEILQKVGANLVGVVLNAVPPHKGNYHYYSYPASYGNESQAQERRPWHLFGKGRKSG